MLALLLKNNRKEIKSEYKQRFLSILLTTFIIIIIFNMIFISSILLLVKQVNLAYINEAENLNNENIDELVLKSERLEDEIFKKIEIIKKPNPIYYPIYDIFMSEINTLNNNGVENLKLNSVEFSLDNRNIKILLKAQAINRQSLISFVSALEENGLFRGINLPISNLTKESNIEFNLDFETSLESFNNYQIK